MSEISFLFAENIAPASYVSNVAADMQRYRSPRDYLRGSRLLLGRDEVVLRDYLLRLIPERVTVKVLL